MVAVTDTILRDYSAPDDADARAIYEASFPPSLRAPWTDLVAHRPDERFMVLARGDASVVGIVLIRRLGETAMAFVEVIRMDEYDRVLVCEADDCEGVLVDFSRNRSKRYCDTGNCGNRMNVNAYRRRRARQTA